MDLVVEVITGVPLLLSVGVVETEVLAGLVFGVLVLLLMGGAGFLAVFAPFVVAEAGAPFAFSTDGELVTEGLFVTDGLMVKDGLIVVGGVAFEVGIDLAGGLVSGGGFDFTDGPSVLASRP